MCDDCGLVYNNPLPSNDELTQFYSNDYRQEYKGAARPRNRQVLRNFRRIRDHMSRFDRVYRGRKSVLDVGAGSGEFLFAAQNLGIRCQGIEPNREYAAYCRETLSLDVQTTQISEFDPGQQRFDLIRLSHVLEHLNDPVGYLSKLSSWLDDDGLLYVEVPNIEDYAVNKSKGNMFHFGHIFNFNPWTLMVAARLAGLEVCPEVENECKNSTGVFFRKTSRKFTAAEGKNIENAQIVQEAITSNYKGHGRNYRINRIAKFFRKSKRFCVETLSSWRMNNAMEIGNFVLQAKATANQNNQTR